MQDNLISNIKTNVMGNSSIKLFLVIISIGAFSSCVSEIKYKEQISENDSLKALLDECINGEINLANLIVALSSTDNYSETLEKIELFRVKYPLSDFNSRFNTLFDITKEKEKERLRIENLHNTGNWYLIHLVDVFGDPTDQKALRTKTKWQNILGQNREVIVQVNNSNTIILSVNYFDSLYYTEILSKSIPCIVSVKASGKTISFESTMKHNMLRLNRNASSQLHNFFLKSGEVKFNIRSITTNPSVIVNFTLENVDYYNNAYELAFN